MSSLSEQAAEEEACGENGKFKCGSLECFPLELGCGCSHRCIFVLIYHKNDPLRSFYGADGVEEEARTRAILLEVSLSHDIIAKSYPTSRQFK